MEGVKVVVRVRPLSKRELDARCTHIIQSEHNVLSISNPKGSRGYQLSCPPLSHLKADCMNHFTFDQCYIEEQNSCSQAMVCEDISSSVMQCAMNSYNASVITFGQKSSGKTFTMMGTQGKDPSSSVHISGLVHRVCEKLFSSVDDMIFTTQLSCLEIYNNQLIDLLCDGNSYPSSSGLHIREHPQDGPYVEELTKYTATSCHDLVMKINSCYLKRKVQTWEQYASNRSHVIITVRHTQAGFIDNYPNEITSKIDLVDLADRITDQNLNIKLNKSEANLLNRSLNSFYDIIKALADAMDRRGTRRKSIYVPYRDSLLTWLLKESLGGRSATFMVATISPAECNYNETLGTLQTANRASRIVNRPTMNLDSHMSRLKLIYEENRMLRSSLAANNMRPQNLLAEVKPLDEGQEKLKRNEEKVHDLIGNWIEKWETIATIMNPSAKELVKSWKDNQQNRIGSCGTDSAFGSDLEAEFDSKSVADDLDRSDDLQRFPGALSQQTSMELGHRISATNLSPLSSPSGNTLKPERPRRYCAFRRKTTPINFQSEAHPQPNDSLRNEVKHVERNEPIVPCAQKRTIPEITRLTIFFRSGEKQNPSGQVDQNLRPLELMQKNSTSLTCLHLPVECASPQTPRTFRIPSSETRERQLDASSMFNRLSNEFILIQNQISDLLNRQQSSMISLRKTTARLMDNVLARLSTVEGLMKKLKEIKPRQDESDEFTGKLEHYSEMLSSLQKIFHINQLLRMVESDLQAHKYTDIVLNMDEACRLTSSLNLEETMEQKASQVFRTEVCLVRERVVCHLVETWNRMLKWHVPSKAILQGTRLWTVSLDLSFLHWHNDIAKTLVETMERLDLLESQIDGFCDLLFIHFFQNLVRNRNTVLQFVEEADRYVSYFTCRPSQHNISVSAVPSEVFHKIQQIFHFLNQPMSKIKVGGLNPDSTAMTLTQKVGSVISKRLFDCIYNECLSQVLQKNGIQWVTFDQVAKATEIFQEAMAKFKLFPSDQLPLTEYLNKIGNHFGQVKSQELLKKAQEFVSSDLADFQKISVDHPLGLVRRKKSIEREEFVKQCKERVRTANYKLPTCQISSPVRSLVCMAYDTLKEASTSSQKGATHLCHSIHGMFELYCDMIPFYHQEKLRTMPLLAALHHNNCMFVAHHLITIEKVFRKDLLPEGEFFTRAKSSSGSENAVTDQEPKSSPAQLGFLVSKIRRLGNQAFGEHVEMEQKETCDHLSNADGFSCVADDEGLNALKAVHDMMHHLKHISLIWRDILPANIYCRAIGSLLNSALTDIIESVVSIEEYSIDDCQNLQKVLSYILDSVIDLFPPEMSKNKSSEVTIQENIISWMKFKELALFFAFSLMDIADRWAAGKGPLALHFSSNDVVRLVVAMFENTSRRTALLKELKENPSIHKQ